MTIVIRYIIYKDKYTKFNYFLDFKKIDFLFFVFIFYTHTHIEREREREISLIIVILFLQFDMFLKYFIIFAFEKKNVKLELI